LLLAVLGMYGVLSYAVGQRTSELGIRLALGASPAALLLMMLHQAARLAVVGIIFGTAAALALGRLISGLLYGVDPADPLTLAAVAMTLFVITLAASLGPALRAARLDPQVTMRES
jgi:putative ABC transport system permease protein